MHPPSAWGQHTPTHTKLYETGYKGGLVLRWRWSCYSCWTTNNNPLVVTVAKEKQGRGASGCDPGCLPQPCAGENELPLQVHFIHTKSSTSWLSCSIALLRPDTYSSSELRVWVVIANPGSRVGTLGRNSLRKKTLGVTSYYFTQVIFSLRCVVLFSGEKKYCYS